MGARPDPAKMRADAERWGMVIEMQDALDCLATLIEGCDDKEVAVPHSVSTIIRLIGRRLDRPLDIEGFG